MQHGLLSGHRCCLLREALLMHPHLSCYSEAIAVVAQTSQRLRLTASGSWARAAQMQTDDFNLQRSLNTTKTDQKQL